MDMQTNTDTDTDTAANGRLAQSLRHMVDEAEHLLRGAADSGDQRLDAMREKFEHLLKRMRMQLNELEDAAAHKARQAARATDHAVHSHPYGAMVAAAAVGVLVGLLVSRR
ncbi:MAG: DUF883 family protein [Methylibium sp.]|nr:DUF883 family protein [Methylibium sp.]MBA3623102.1 DUF883 family protein [Methylibium sp.]